MSNPSPTDDTTAEAPDKLDGTPFKLSIDDTGINGAGITAEILPSAPSSNISAGLSAISSEESNGPIVKRFVRFATALAFIPFAVYLAVLQFFRTVGAGIVLPQGITPQIVSGIAAVLTVNIITSVFALLAVREQAAAASDDPAPPSQEHTTAADGHDKTE